MPFGEKSMERIYVCHTYYHAYVAFLKEFYLRSMGAKPDATLVLSRMSCDFESFDERVKNTGVFTQVLAFDEQSPEQFPELEKYKKDTGNFVKNLLQRIKYTKRLSQLEEPYIPVDFRQYKDIYVFCDSDPIGVYLNRKRIAYHGMEDGLNCLKNFDAARYDNRGHFGIKVFFSKTLNLIHIQNGWSKYCIDMEVNDIAAIPNPCPRFVELPRQSLVARLTPQEKDWILQAFVRDKESLEKMLSDSADTKDKILILTDPLCTLDIRERIFRDLYEIYSKEGQVFFKPHPRDILDYRTLFAEVPQFDATMPMEMLSYFPDVHFKKVIGVLTEMKAIDYADEVVRLGPDFMDAYEAPEIHRQNEQIY